WSIPPAEGECQAHTTGVVRPSPDTRWCWYAHAVPRGPSAMRSLCTGRGTASSHSSGGAACTPLQKISLTKVRRTGFHDADTANAPAHVDPVRHGRDGRRSGLSAVAVSVVRVRAIEQGRDLLCRIRVARALVVSAGSAAGNDANDHVRVAANRPPRFRPD